MNLTVRIQDILADVEVLYVWEDYPEWDSDYTWEEGNYSCDCNRGDFMWREIDPKGDHHFLCGHERFFVELKDEDGNILYSDIEEKNEARR